ncbi:response regulator [Desulfobacterota bacterium M19]
MNVTRVLVVEDEDDHFELIKRGFERQAVSGKIYQLERAGTLKEGLKKVQDQKPDLVISDWKLPDGDGIAMISRGKDGAVLYPVVIMTSFGNEAWAVEAMRMGALDYVVKSPDMMAEMARVSERAIREWNGIADRKRLEAQLRQSQKMEAVGHLAGGIAHDFNNILTAIMGYGNLLAEMVGEQSDLKPLIDPILRSAERAADLTRQILAFSRKQRLSPKKIELNSLIDGIHNLMRRLIGEDIAIKINYSAREIFVVVDPGQIEQVLMNLCTNARDAMPQGGTLSIATSVVELDEHDAGLHELAEPGAYALISLSDTGRGIDEETRRMIFEPFFTTKVVGKGTGLGLSIVYGIIKQHKGQITVYSESGIGTTFKIYLPLPASQEDQISAERQAAVPALKGTETILLAEDDPEARKLLTMVLEESGYRVIAAVDGEDAIRKFSEYGDDIDLLLFDVVMPGKSGKEACNFIRQIRPTVKVLFMSGYTADIIIDKGLAQDDFNFIAKPVSPRELRLKIRDVLNSANI